MRIPSPEPLPRATHVHAEACVDCPSAHFESDPECKEILSDTNRERLIQSQFSCAWRPGGLCKGYHDKVCQRLAELRKANEK
jgi:hypothetical protein